MPRLWDIIDDKSKEILVKAARQQGMLSFSPDKPRQQPPVSVQGVLEDEEEIKVLMSLTPEKFKERFEE